MSQSQSKKRAQRKDKDDADGADLESQLSTVERWTEEALVKNVVQYVFIMQQKKHPMKKLDIIKHAMNRQGPQFKQVMEEVARTLKSTFGVLLVGFKGLSERVEDVAEGTHFMIVSKLKICPLNMGDLVECEHLNEMHMKVGLLRTFLSCFYMINRDMDETELWNIMEKTEASEILCRRKEELRKFLKQEYVDTMYMNREEIKGVDGSTFRYSWGLRAELECNKYQLLKCIAKQMKKKPFEFKLQFVELMNDEKYNQEIQEDFARMGEAKESQPENRTRNVEVQLQDQDTQELDDIPDSNMCTSAGKLQSQRTKKTSSRLNQLSDGSSSDADAGSSESD